MMNQLCIEDGDIVVVQYASLALAVYSKFQPQTVDFLDIHNPKAVYPGPVAFCTSVGKPAALNIIIVRVPMKCSWLLA